MIWVRLDCARLEQVEQIQDEAKGHHKEELEEKRVFQDVFHFCNEAIAGGTHAWFVATCEDQ